MLDKGISVYAPESSKAKLQDLCRTRWIERHEAYETFTELYSVVVEALNVVLNERRFLEEYGDWKWDRETLTKANGLMYALTNFEFIVALECTMKCMSIIKPVSVKLQKRSNDIVKAHNHVKGVKMELLNTRTEADAIFSRLI